MKLNYFLGYSHTEATPLPLDKLVELIQYNQSLKVQTEKYRYLRSVNDEKSADRIKSGTPCFAVAVRFRAGGKAKKDIDTLTGLSLVDIDHIPAERMGEVIRLVREDPHTLLSYITISGCGLRILFRIEGLADVSATPAHLKRYAAAFAWGNRYYAELTGCECDGKCKNITRLSGLAHDEAVCYRPDATAFTQSEIRNSPSKYRKVSPRLLAVIRKELAEQGIVYEEHRHNEYIMRTGYLLNAFGVHPEAAIRWAEKEFADYEGDVAGIFRSCYQHTEEHGTRALLAVGGKDAGSVVYASVEEIEAFLNEQARFRFNVITGKVEYLTTDSTDSHRFINCPADGSPSCHSEERSDEESENAKLMNADSSLAFRMTLNNQWTEIDDRFVNSLWSRMCKQVKCVRAVDLRAVLASEFVPLFNPFECYLNALPLWDGQTDYITELADTVTVKGNEQPFFRKYFKKWLVNVVASLLEPEIVNHEILVFIGPQGCYKTTWMNRLLPPELRRFFHVKTNSNRITKDDLFSLTEFALICLEEIDELRTSDMNQLKALVSKPEVNERAAYGHYKERRPHLASFCGTTNNVQFLTDLSGSRRWLPIEVERILNPFTHPVNYAGVFSQAFALFKAGFEFFLSPEEVQEVNQRNHQYEVPCLEVELIQMLFEVPKPDSKGVLFLTTAQILHRINAWVRHLLSPTKIGIAMVKAGFEPTKSKGKRGYRVIELNNDRIQANAKLLGL